MLTVSLWVLPVLGVLGQLFEFLFVSAFPIFLSIMADPFVSIVYTKRFIFLEVTVE